MFEIVVWDLLADYLWASKEIRYTGPVDPWYFEEFEIVGDIDIAARLTHIDSGVELHVSIIQADILMGDTLYSVDIPSFERTFRRFFDPVNPEDLDAIDMETGVMDLYHVIREEVLMFLHY